MEMSDDGIPDGAIGKNLEFRILAERHRRRESFGTFRSPSQYIFDFTPKHGRITGVFAQVLASTHLSFNTRLVMTQGSKMRPSDRSRYRITFRGNGWSNPPPPPKVLKHS